MITAISKNALALGAAAAICVGVLSFVNMQTAPRINEQALANKIRVLADVLPDAAASQDLLHDCVQVTDIDLLGRDTAQSVYRWRNNGAVAAYIVETTAPEGYSGNIDLIVAVTPQGTVLGSRVVAHQETPGLGDKVEERRSGWIYGFNDKTVSKDNAAQWAVRKDGGQFDQFTGATITPRAVVKAVRNAALYVLAHPQLATMPANCPAPTQGH